MFRANVVDPGDVERLAKDVARSLGPIDVLVVNATPDQPHEPIEGYEHHLRTMVASDGAVMTEHAETWRWHTGEVVTLPFCSVHELVDGKIVRWWDYWDLQTLMDAAPPWWIEHIMGGYE